jgi:hypothetical protein
VVLTRFWWAKENSLFCEAVSLLRLRPIERAALRPTAAGGVFSFLSPIILLYIGRHCQAAAQFAVLCEELVLDKMPSGYA